MAIFVLGATSVAAEIVPTLSTKTLTDSANVIVVGRVDRVEEAGTGDVTLVNRGKSEKLYGTWLILESPVFIDSYGRASIELTCAL